MGQYVIFFNLKKKQNDLSLSKLDKETKTVQASQTNEFALMAKENDLNNQLAANKNEAESSMTEKNMKLYSLNEMTNFITQTLYAKLNCVNQTNYIGDEAMTGMPLLAMLT
jgi:hypothetical protein